ncbi:MAG: hypothetical protein LQ347_005706 [Umbilicaria vellea]|nr:MAG: hypothetical protein LQ347_005706 [Umbilicaria vellea]
MAVWFANFFLLSQAADLRATNNLFLFAMLVVALIYAFNASSTYAVEAFLLLNIRIRDIAMRSTRATFIESAARAKFDHSQGYRILSFKTTKNALETIPGRSPKAATFADIKAVMPYCSKSCQRFTWPGAKGVNPCRTAIDMEEGRDKTLFWNRAAGGNAARSERVKMPACTYFERVFEAEIYLEDALSVYSPKVRESMKNRCVRLLHGHSEIAVPKPESECDPQTPPYLECLRRIVAAEWSGRPPLHLRICLAIHITALQQHSVLGWPRVVEKMAQLNQKQEPPDWRTLTVASDISLSHMPLVISPRIWTIMASETLAMIVFLIVQVELTIVWNSISGLSSLSTLGQLIPFILGMGGLLKVLWQKFELVRKGVKEEAMVQKYTSPYEEAMEIYLTWKQDRKKQRSLPLSSSSPLIVSV